MYVANVEDYVHAFAVISFLYSSDLHPYPASLSDFIKYFRSACISRKAKRKHGLVLLTFSSSCLRRSETAIEKNAAKATHLSMQKRFYEVIAKLRSALGIRLGGKLKCAQQRVAGLSPHGKFRSPLSDVRLFFRPQTAVKCALLPQTW